MPIPQNAQTHSHNSSTICRRIVWVCLTILWNWRLKGKVYQAKSPSWWCNVSYCLKVNMWIIEYLQWDTIRKQLQYQMLYLQFECQYYPLLIYLLLIQQGLFVVMKNQNLGIWSHKSQFPGYCACWRGRFEFIFLKVRCHSFRYFEKRDYFYCKFVILVKTFVNCSEAALDCKGYQHNMSA